MTDISDLGKIVELIEKSSELIKEVYPLLKLQKEEELKISINKYREVFSFDVTGQMAKLDKNCDAFPKDKEDFEDELANIYLLMNYIINNLLKINFDAKILEKTKENLKLIAETYDKAIKNLNQLQFDKSIEKLINNEAYKSLFREFAENLNSKENYLRSIKLEASINGKTEPITLDSINNIIIFDKSYFIERQQDAALLLGEHFLGYLITIIKETAETDDGANKITDNLLASLTDSDKFKAKAAGLTIIINDLRSAAYKMIKQSKMKNNEITYLKIEKGIDFNDYSNEANELLTKILNLKPLDDTAASAASLFDISFFLISQKKISLFKKIKEQEGKIIKAITGKDLILTPDLTLGIDKLLNYALMASGKKDQLTKMQENADNINQLRQFATMENYTNKDCDYKSAKEELEEAIKQWKTITDFKILDSEADKEERAKELETIVKVLEDLNKFNGKIFEKINKYTNDFKTGFNIGNNKENIISILANEISKVRYYEDLLTLLQIIKDKRTEKTENNLKNLLKGKSSKINELNKYKAFIDEKIKKGVYLVKNIDKIEDFDNKDNFQFIKDAIESIGNYLTNMKEIGKIINEFIIK